MFTLLIHPTRSFYMITNILLANSMKLNCRFCFIDLWHEHTFIKCTTDACTKLGVSICLQCFAAGTGDHVHKNTDPYKIQCNAVEISEQSWPAHEDIILLDTFMDTMSWERVAQKLDRSPKECERHYFDNFVFYPKIKGLEYVNKNAFRFNTFDRVVEDKTQTFGDTLDIEGTYITYIIHKIIVINVLYQL